MKNGKTTVAGIMAILGGLICCGAGLMQMAKDKDGVALLVMGGGFITTGLGLLGAKDEGK